MHILSHRIHKEEENAKGPSGIDVAVRAETDGYLGEIDKRSKSLRCELIPCDDFHSADLCRARGLPPRAKAIESRKRWPDPRIRGFATTWQPGAFVAEDAG